MIKIYVLIDPKTNLIRYVGKTKNEKQRLHNHLNKLHNEKSHKRNWINLLRKEKLKPIFKVIEEVTEENWKERERYWINHYRELGFNLTNCGEGGEGLSFANDSSFKKGDEAWNKGKGNTKICVVCNTLFKVSPSVDSKRTTCSINCRKKLDNYHKETQFKKGVEAWNKGKNIKLKGDKNVFQYCAHTGNFIKKWNTAKEVNLAFNINPSGIGQCCNNRAKSAGGFIWRYYEQDKIEIIENVKLKIKNI